MLETKVSGNGSHTRIPSVKVRAEEPVLALGRAAKQASMIDIPAPVTKVITLAAIGTAPLIIKGWDVKAGEKVLRKQQQEGAKERTKHEKRDPFSDFKAACYLMPGASFPKGRLEIGESWPYKPNTFAVPGRSFKAAILDAATMVGFSRKLVASTLFVLGHMLPIKYKRVQFVQDFGRVTNSFGKKSMVLIFRPYFHEWSVDLPVRYDEGFLKIEQVIRLAQRAGISQGVGEWRPSSPDKPGDNGTFELGGK